MPFLAFLPRVEDRFPRIGVTVGQFPGRDADDRPILTMQIQHSQVATTGKIVHRIGNSCCGPRLGSRKFAKRVEVNIVARVQRCGREGASDLDQVCQHKV